MNSEFTNIIISTLREYNPEMIGVFGSYARKDNSAQSDIDLLVEFEEPIGLEFVTLAEELEKLLGIRVDLVSINAIKPKMRKIIMKDIVYV